MADERMYILQPSFAAGEISPDVANRVDLGKYQSALLQAKNFFIRPYGSAYRRPGMVHVADLTGTGNVLLKEFGISEQVSYLLEFGNNTLNVWRDGVKKATLSTPYAASELKLLRFAQSASIMFIACSNHPVQLLRRNGDTSWAFSEFVAAPAYFDGTTNIEGTKITPSGISGTVTLTYSGSAALFNNQVGNWVKLTQLVKPSVREIDIKIPKNTKGQNTGGRKAKNAYWNVSTTGTWTGTVRVEFSDDGQKTWQTMRTYTGKDDTNIDETGYLSRETWLRLNAEISLGSVTVTLRYTNPDNNNIDSVSLSANAGRTSTERTSSSALAGKPGWKVTSHGTWTGSFQVQYSEDNSTWQTLRTYSSKDDFNATETGTFEENTYIRLYANIASGNFNATLTALSYNNIGTARITAVASGGKSCTAQVQKKFAYAEATDKWELGSWSAAYGYPSAIAFFQDRLCLAANNKYPYMVWMSRTGDYWNFEVESEGGEILDDSAVALSFISRRDYKIKHLLAFSDLLVLTEGNEWILSGSETVTPKQATPKLQTARGCSDVEPDLIGGQLVYIQKGGKTVRDMQYSYTTDSYDGADLTILAKHLMQDATVIATTYKQDPDSMLVCVLSDGTAACLTYVNDQKVYAWSRIVTDGTIKAAEVVNTGDGNDLYFVVDRDNGRYLELLHEMGHSDDPNDYIMLDCAEKGTNSTASKTITAAWLKNKTVDVLADGEHIMGLQADSAGTVTLDVPCTKYVIGLRYNSTLEMPNIELQLSDGTMQGRKKKVSAAILRLSRSLGGKIGITTDKMDIVKYDEFMAQTVTLYSGEKNVTVPNIAIGGFNNWGRIVLYSSYPYPLSVASIVRVVVPGG